MKKEYCVIINLKECHHCVTFQEAWIKMMEEVQSKIKRNTRKQLLETTYFIVFKYRNNMEFPLSFYNARVFAHKIGIMKKDGGSVVVNDEYSAEDMEPYIADAFAQCAVVGVDSINEIVDLVEELKALDLCE